mmetsp:Transcript_36826/g.89692  ORF Transcript_36826/g.89692 Transcript_36826/m.89692 type:complete len:152 (-) Transcript_36826:959-1414(-)
MRLIIAFLGVQEVRLVVERKRLGSVGGNVVSIGLSMAGCSRGAETLGLRHRLAGQEGRPLAARRRPTPAARAALLLRPSVGPVAGSTQKLNGKFECPIFARRGAQPARVSYVSTIVANELDRRDTFGVITLLNLEGINFSAVVDRASKFVR